MKRWTCWHRTATRRPCPADRARVRRAVAVAATVAFAALGAIRADPSDDALRRYASKTGQPDPLIRIGFDDAPRVRVEAGPAYRIVDPATGRDVWRERYAGEVVVLAEGAPEGGAGTVFRVQVAAFSTREAAEAERTRLQGSLGVPAVVRYDADRGSWRVRVGESPTRDGLAKVVERLRAAGGTGHWIAEEPAREIGGVTLRLVDAATFESRVVDLGRIAVVPDGTRPVTVDDVAYRGVVEVRVTDYGTVRAINWVGLENYLLGVVPAELGPEVWPLLEALKAQAVAARTYAWKHLGQFGDEGFDQCATPRCQVYKGRDAEHPLSDRAVAATRGEIVTYEGRPINAMFTATCGGHTEDAGEIFPEERAPYLKGVPCRAESDALRTRRFRLEGVDVGPVLDGSGRDVTRDWAVLASANVVPGDPAAVAGRVRASDLETWTGNVRRLAGIPGAKDPSEPIEGLGDAAVRLVTALGWSERAEVLLAGEDLEAILRDPATDDLPEDERRALAYLVRIEALTPSADGRFEVASAPDGARLLPALAAAAETYEALGLRVGTIEEFRKGSLRLHRGKGEATVAVGERPFLFGLAGGRAVAVRSLELWPGDRVRYRTGSDGRIVFLELVPPVTGVSDDRSARLYSWDERLTRRELERSIRKRVDVGTLEDLRVVRRGVSGRVVELEVVGDRGRETVRGFDIRRLLGLRESLVVFEIQRDPDGVVQAIAFSGKGWGHGIGMCQVGAYGMALRGEDYRAILTHYYQGTRIERSTTGR